MSQAKGMSSLQNGVNWITGEPVLGLDRGWEEKFLTSWAGIKRKKDLE